MDGVDGGNCGRLDLGGDGNRGGIIGPVGVAICCLFGTIKLGSIKGGTVLTVGAETV